LGLQDAEFTAANLDVQTRGARATAAAASATPAAARGRKPGRPRKEAKTRITPSGSRSRSILQFTQVIPRNDPGDAAAAEATEPAATAALDVPVAAAPVLVATTPVLVATAPALVAAAADPMVITSDDDDTQPFLRASSGSRESSPMTDLTNECQSSGSDQDEDSTGSETSADDDVEMVMANPTTDSDGDEHDIEEE